MKFFADTANLEEIAYCFSQGISDGITTNPKILETTGDLSSGVEAAYKSLVSRYSDVPISLETDLAGMTISEVHLKPMKVKRVLLEQAKKLSGFGDNVIIKIPMCAGGLKASKELIQNGIKTNVTVCITPYQAIEAAKTGSTYVSLFANRMLDAHILQLTGQDVEKILSDSNWKNILKTNKEKYFDQAWDRTLSQIAYVAEYCQNNGSQLIIGSIRTPEDIYKIASAGPQVITVPTKIAEGLKNIAQLKKIKRSVKSDEAIMGDSIYHPMTDYTLKEFEKAAEACRNSNN